MALSLYTGVTTPGASVSVYHTGTTVLATIYASAASTAKTNPVTATNGSYGFWIEDGVYDIANGSMEGDLIRVSVLSYRDARLPSDEVSVVPYRSNTIKTVQKWIEKVTDWLWSGGLVFPKTSGAGIKVDTDAPVFPWMDIIGSIRPKAIGAGSPARSVYQGNIQQYKFVLNDTIDCEFHLPHDYVPGTDLYLHVHWSHTGTTITGDAVFTHYTTYAKGHNQAPFPAEVTNTLTWATTNIATTPQYQHRIEEIALSAVGGTTTVLNTTNLEADGLILTNVKLTTLPTLGGGGGLFIHFIDIHYQSTGIGTKNKAPDFWT